MAPAGGIWVPMAQRVLRQALTAGSKAAKGLRNRVAAAARGELEPVPIRTTSSLTRGQPVHPAALRRQLASGRRWYSTAQSTARRFFSAATRGTRATHYTDRVEHLRSAIADRAVWKATGRVPFASTLRPSLTGGTLSRTAGGYVLGGTARGARHFSHTPAAPAEVVQHVSQAMRAFWLSGQRARFDHTDARGRACYRAVGTAADEAARRVVVPALPPLAPGSFVDFSLSPTITAIGKTCSTTTPATLGTEGFLDVLNVDFARALKELGAIMVDLQRLAAVGDLPVVLDGSALHRGATLRVRFPGVDARTVDRLCEDLGVTRGVVGQDAAFEASVGAQTALKFPFAPSAGETPNLSSPGGSVRSRQSSALSELSLSELLSAEDEDVYAAYFSGDASNPWQSVGPSSVGRAHADPWPSSDDDAVAVSSGGTGDYEGLEGVYRFLEACDRASPFV